MKSMPGAGGVAAYAWRPRAYRRAPTDNGYLFMAIRASAARRRRVGQPASSASAGNRTLKRALAGSGRGGVFQQTPRHGVWPQSPSRWQAQARAIGPPSAPVKGLEDQFALGLGHAGARVFHPASAPAKGVGCNAGGDHAPVFRRWTGCSWIALSTRLRTNPEQRGLPLSRHAGRARLGTAVAQVDVLLHRAGARNAHHLIVSSARSHGWRAMLHATAFGPRQRQQLVHGVRGTDAGASDVPQRALELFRAGALRCARSACMRRSPAAF